MSYNNNYNSSYGFGSNNYSNFTNYTTLQQDKVSQVVNLLEKCSIEQLEKINGKLAEIKQKKENQFWNDIYMWCYNNPQILNRINEIELKAALQCNSVLFNKQQYSSLVKYIDLKRFITDVVQYGKFDHANYSYITDSKDVNVFEQKARQIVQNAQQAIIDIKTQNQTNYNQHLYNENMRATIRKFMENDFKNWFKSIWESGLWKRDDGKTHNDIMYTNPQKDAERLTLCEKAGQIYCCNNDIDKLAKFLNCQPSGVITEVKRFMQKCNVFIRRYGKHQNITYHTDYGLGGSHNNMNYNHNMIGNYPYL